MMLGPRFGKKDLSLLDTEFFANQKMISFGEIYQNNCVEIILSAYFLDAYLNHQTIFFGSLLGSVLLFLLGSILSVTSIILFSMANLNRDR